MAFSDLDRLFIIGNGFDLAHGLKTSYENFRQYLLNVENIQTPGENFCPNDILQLISRCAGTARWCDIETDLGYVSGQVKSMLMKLKIMMYRDYKERCLEVYLKIYQNMFHHG